MPAACPTRRLTSGHHGQSQAADQGAQQRSHEHTAGESNDDQQQRSMPGRAADQDDSKQRQTGRLALPPSTPIQLKLSNSS